VADVGGAELFFEFRHGVGDEPGFVLFVVLADDFDRVALVLELDRFDFPARDFLRDEREVAAFGAVAPTRRDQFGGKEREHDDDQDRERGALEETAHSEISVGSAAALISAYQPFSVPREGRFSGMRVPYSCLTNAATNGR